MESVLLQEADADDAGDLDDQFLVVGQHVRADQLDDLHQVIFLQQQVGDRAHGSDIKSWPTLS